MISFGSFRIPLSLSQRFFFLLFERIKPQSGDNSLRSNERGEEKFSSPLSLLRCSLKQANDQGGRINKKKRWREARERKYDGLLSLRKWAISELSCASFSKRVLCMAFHTKMSFHSHADKTHFHMKGCAPCLALKERHKTTRKCLVPRFGKLRFPETSPFG